LVKLTHLLGLVVLVASLVTTACNREQQDGPERPEPVASKNAPPPDSPPPQPQPPKTPADASTPASAAACDTLDRNECISALHCTLHWIADGKYECRDSKGPCEESLMQSDRRTCESRDGCAWNPGECYCRFPGYGQAQVPDKAPKDSGGACACGGGPPPLCESK
jgi:hypothetical protein